MNETRQKDARIAIMLLIIGSIIYFILRIRLILLPFVLGIFLSYIFYPLVSFLRKRKVPKSWAIYIFIIVLLLIIAVIAFIILPVLIKEVELLSKNIPDYIEDMNKYIDRLNHDYRKVQLPAIIKESINRNLLDLEEKLIDFTDNISEFLLNSFTLLVSLIVAPFISYYILKDLDKFKNPFICILSDEKKKLFERICKDINKIFLAYIRGQLWVSIIVGFLSIIGLYLLDIRFSLMLGIFATLSNMVPFIGPIIGSIPAILIALLSSPGKALSVVILYFIIQEIESSFISPKIMSQELGIHPLSVLFAVLLGAELIGIWGIILAVPAAASFNVFLNILLEKYQVH
ncbi:MAG: AI-2E family transporter [Halanaerobiaceae bacterium]